MQIRNVSSLVASVVPGRRADGREVVVAVVKATYQIPSAGGELILAPEQEPLIFTDIHADEPGLSPVLYESDFAPLKPRCDVVVVGRAIVPNGRLQTQLDVRLQVSNLIDKTIRVVGNRAWKRGLFGVKASAPEPFSAMPLSWDRAWGGSDFTHPKAKFHRHIYENHVGCGLHTNLDRAAVDGKSLPNLEDPTQPVVKPDGVYQPVGFAPVARSCQPRLAHAGTYDKKWQDELAPFPPDDFRDDYHQYAPVDQQIPYPSGGEQVHLTNCTPSGSLSFLLPTLRIPVNVHRHNHHDDDLQANLDTIVIRPDLHQVICLWRAHAVIRSNLTEVKEVIIGHMSPGFFRARRLGKEWHPSVQSFIQSRKRDST
jgi:hypothetical protein